MAGEHVEVHSVGGVVRLHESRNQGFDGQVGRVSDLALVRQLCSFPGRRVCISTGEA